MAVVNHRARRGKVYQWRRRVPPTLEPLPDRTHLAASLRTRDGAEAAVKA